MIVFLYLMFWVTQNSEFGALRLWR